VKKEKKKEAAKNKAVEEKERKVLEKAGKGGTEDGRAVPRKRRGRGSVAQTKKK
jgi:hypothetical protein